MKARLNQSGGVNLNVIGTKYKAQSNLWSTEKFWNHRRSIAPSSSRLYWSGAVKINLDIHRSTTLPVFSPAESWVYRDCWVSKYMHSTVLYLISTLILKMPDLRKLGDLGTSICQVCQCTVAVLVSEYLVSIYRRVSSFTLFILEGMSPNFFGRGRGAGRLRFHSENGDNFGHFLKMF